MLLVRKRASSQEGQRMSGKCTNQDGGVWMEKVIPYIHLAVTEILAMKKQAGNWDIQCVPLKRHWQMWSRGYKGEGSFQALDKYNYSKLKMNHMDNQRKAEEIHILTNEKQIMTKQFEGRMFFGRYQ